MKLKSNINNMELIATQFNYNYWQGTNNKGVKYYNVTPKEQPQPKGGYFSATYICKIKRVPNLFN
jgi:hypothetical protein